jgi:hypothetical protein
LAFVKRIMSSVKALAGRRIASASNAFACASP